MQESYRPRSPQRRAGAQRHMRMRPEPRQILSAAESFSTADIADALGVSVSTVKRWVDEGILRAYRTVGGHRRLRGEDVAAAVRSRLLPHRDLTALETLMRPAPVSVVKQRLIRALQQGDGGRVRRLLRAARHGGLSFAGMADDVIAPAMAEIGLAWKSGRIDVFEEHRATQLCQAGMYELKSTVPFVAPGRRPLALGGGPEGDPYIVANVMAELVLLEGGWNVMNLGPNTPMTSFVTAIERFRPRLVWLSVTHLVEFAAFRQGCGALSRAASRMRIGVIAGGQAITPERCARLPLTTGRTLAELQALAASLR